MLVMIKAILYERTVAVCASMDSGNGLGRSEPWGDSRKKSKKKSSIVGEHVRIGKTFGNWEFGNILCPLRRQGTLNLNRLMLQTYSDPDIEAE